MAIVSDLHYSCSPPKDKHAQKLSATPHTPLFRRSLQRCIVGDLPNLHKGSSYPRVSNWNQLGHQRLFGKPELVQWFGWAACAMTLS